MSLATEAVSFEAARPVMRIVASPVGALRLLATDRALIGIYFPEHRPSPPTSLDGSRSVEVHPILDQVATQLDDYFAGRRRAFDLPTAAAGTPFQRAVWAALATIPYGATWSYGELAHAIGKPSAVRAVGAANGRNPLSIVVPCHRVIGRRGDAVGYAGGVTAKQHLLALERGR